MKITHISSSTTQGTHILIGRNWNAGVQAGIIIWKRVRSTLTSASRVPNFLFSFESQAGFLGALFLTVVYIYTRRHILYCTGMVLYEVRGRYPSLCGIPGMRYQYKVPGTKQRLSHLTRAQPDGCPTYPNRRLLSAPPVTKHRSSFSPLLARAASVSSLT